jgi:uncharacterized protein (DUF169 family)
LLEENMKKWAEYSQRLKDILCLEGSPVGVALRGKPLEGIDTPQKGFTFCQFVVQARVKRKALQGNAQNILCCKGASALGLYETPANVMSGKRDAGRKVKDRKAAEVLQKEIPRIVPGTFNQVIVAPLEKIPIDPDVILIVGYPAQIWRIAQSVNWKDGKRLSFSTSTSQGVCVDGVVVPFLGNQVNISLGCTGMRVFAGYSEHHLVMGLSRDRFIEMMEGLEATSSRDYTYPIPYETFEASPQLPRAWTIMREIPKEVLEKLPKEIQKILK